MNKLIKITLFIMFHQTFISASGGNPPPPPLYYANAKNALYQPPLVLAGHNESTCFFHFAYTTTSTVKSRIDLEGTSTDLNGLIDGNNFNWKIPSLTFRAGISPAISENSSLLFIINGNKTGNISNFYGFDFGYNYILSRSQDQYAKLGFGLDFHTNDFEWIQNSEGHSRTDNSLEFDPFITFTYNTNFKDWLFNPFFQVSYCKQTLVDTKEQSKQEIYKNLNVMTLTPGLSYNIANDIKISFGTLFYYELDIGTSGKLLITPFMQMSCGL